MNFSDPLGLCPYGQAKVDENVNDCPKDALGNGFRLLASSGGETGKATISTVAHNHASFDLRSHAEVASVCKTDTHGCTVGSKIYLDDAADAEDLATRVTHEATHMRLGNTSSYAEQEPIAWGNALNVYGRLRSTAGTSKFYEGPLLQRQSDPAQFKRNMCVAAGGTKC